MGCQSSQFWASAFDRAGGAWICGDSGITHLFSSWQISVYDAQTGLGRSPIIDVARYHGLSYAVAHEGLFRLASADDATKCPRFQRVEGVGMNLFAAATHPQGLLLGGDA
jgi:hypothetical protein